MKIDSDNDILKTTYSQVLSSIPIFLNNNQIKKPFVIFSQDVKQAIELKDTWKFFYPEDNVIYFPNWELLPYERISVHKDLISRRLLSLWQIVNNLYDVLIVQIDTAMQMLPPKNFILKYSLYLKINEIIDIDLFKSNLVDVGYINVNNVLSMGEFAVRGGIIDIFPLGSRHPFRIDLFDKEIESIKIFDIETQRTSSNVDFIRIFPNHEFPTDKEAITTFCNNFLEKVSNNKKAIPYNEVSNKIFNNGIDFFFPLFFNEDCHSIFDYINQDNKILLLGNIHQTSLEIEENIKERYNFANTDTDYPVLHYSLIFLRSNEFFQYLKSYSVDDIKNLSINNSLLPDVNINHHQRNPLLNLINFINEFDGSILFVVENLSRMEIVSDLFSKYNLYLTKIENWNTFYHHKNECKLAITNSKKLFNGFILDNEKIAIITELDLYSSTSRIFIKKRKKVNQDFSFIRNLAEIDIDDLVVHEDHGIGIYRGLVSMDYAQDNSEFMLLEYQDGAKLYVPIANLHLVSKYIGKKNDLVAINQLGSSKWKKSKQRALIRAYDTAAELLDLFAKRQLQKGFVCRLDKSSYNEFVDGFNYEETDDQIDAINEVVKDLLKEQPMDRLICGDVGFGKTEIALRASFITSMSGKQVAVLVPTTLLAEQHFNVFKERFINFPVRIRELSRFQTSSENKKYLEELALGQIDIIIGTHKLLQPNIKFKDLGLVIIDEEHRFGVRQKEQLKQIRNNVNVLSLTATPIPRTLYMALEGLRDLSIIATPPKKRLAIKTFVHEYSNSLIVESITREIRRNGQVYFLHNEVDTIENMYQKIHNLLPNIRICIAHGQLHSNELERVMRDFLRHKYDLMLCSTIIETGIDIPNVNTIIINRADKFGIAQLHQLRGRVGRSNHQAYAYLLIPEYISKEAQKRLDAIVSSNELGAGFMLAMNDLEIRGSGEILGENQSGEANLVGITLYSSMLKKAINDLKNKKVIDKEHITLTTNVTEINLHVPAIIPKEYCSDVRERLILYKRLSEANNNSEIMEIYEEVIDRFGFAPESLKLLIESHKLRILANILGIDKIDIGANKIIFTFNNENKLDINKIIALIQSDKTCKLQQNNKLIIDIAIEDIHRRILYTKEIINKIK